MPSALVHNNTVVDFYAGSVPTTINLSNGDIIMGASDALMGRTFTDSSELLSAVYDDTGKPLAISFEDAAKRAYNITGNTVHVTRTWITPVQSPVSVQVNSASTPALNAPYSLTKLGAYASIVQQVQASGTFPDSTSYLIVNDENGIPHSFTTAAFLAFYYAMSLYANALSSGQTPKTPLTIV